jgi:hypothetical protein
VASVKAAYANARPPKEVHQAFQLLLVYLGVGLAMMIVALVFAFTLLSGVTGSIGLGVGPAIVGLIIGLIIYAAVLYVAIMMRAGKQWARITIAVLAGLGALSALISLLGAFGVGAFFGGVYSIISVVVALIQLAAAAGVLILIFRPNVNSYFT